MRISDWSSDVCSSDLLTIALIFWSAMTGLAGLAQSFWHLFLTRVGVAAGEAAFTPTAPSLLAESFPPNKPAFAIAIANSAVSLGIMSVLACSGWVGGG